MADDVTTASVQQMIHEICREKGIMSAQANDPGFLSAMVRCVIQKKHNGETFKDAVYHCFEENL